MGNEKRKLKTRLRGPIATYLNMPFSEFGLIQEKLKASPDDFTMLDVAAINYVANMSKDFRYINDHRDRSEGRSVQKTEVSGPDGEPIEYEKRVDLSKLSKKSLNELLSAVDDANKTDT